MNNTQFLVYNDMSIDYNLLGEYPKDIDKFDDEKLFNYFIDCFRLTFSNTVFSYYGDLAEIKEQIDNSLLKDEIDYKNKTNKQKWAILFLIIFDMFFRLHNTYLAQDTLAEVCEYFDTFSNEELLTIIHDLNFALFFGIEECMVVSPSRIMELNASNEDNFIMEDLIVNKKIFLKIIKDHIKKKDINKEHFEDLFKVPLNNNYPEILYDGFVSAWIEMMDDEDIEALQKQDLQTWEEVSAEVYAIISTFFSLSLNIGDNLLSLAEAFYYTIMTIYKQKLGIKHEIYSIDLK